MVIKAVDLYSGVGGLTHGLIKSGINVTLGIDIDETCKYAYETNNNAKFLAKDVREIKSEDMLSYYEGSDYKVLVGCAPCQPFSNYSNTASEEKKKEKWFLLDEFSRLVMEIMPDIVSMENVPQLRKKDVFREFVDVLKGNGYYVDYDLIYCPDYGIPQSRTRLVLLASRLGKINLPQITHEKSTYVTVREIIGHLKPIEAGDRDEKDPLHIASSLSKKNMDRIKQSKPGGTWADWDKKLIAKCHKKKTGSTYTSVYGRMEWDKVSPTITTQFNGFGNGRFGHPEQNRGLSLREGALLQSFPENYIFFNNEKPIVMKNVSTHIGNAVPVRLGEVIGNEIIRHIGGIKSGREIRV
ncbi:MAG TPA: DNA (cytosine-5-)-methyltransferase [Clostridiales bacterium]|nr:MAG: DNA (cytosine-5-)-methyltransferase [Clostridiales bacterium GWD2_32_19]HCC06823.1 DNA (cytosine-5-)-methyltransferase [Clostridiales bacterium]